MPELFSAFHWLYQKRLNRMAILKNSVSKHFKINAVSGKCRQVITLFLLIVLLSILSLSEILASKDVIYFYNPETNINNFVLLKKEFDKYLSEFGQFTFQPFSDRKTFEKSAANKRDVIFLISSWHFLDLKKKIQLKPVFMGISKGKPTQRKILFSRGNSASIDYLKGKSVASSGSEGYTKNILLQMLGKEVEDSVDTLKILTVPKDIDALMALGLGMVDAALCTEHTQAELSEINPKLCVMLKELASTETYLQIVAVPNPSDENIELALSIIAKMTSSIKGRRNLKMISLDGWKKVSKAERKYLEN